jgi:hypothetical protein
MFLKRTPPVGQGLFNSREAVDTKQPDKPQQLKLVSKGRR